MISCTEFIPLYSEFFKYLEKRGGHDAVMDYWIHISDSFIGDKTNPNSLAYKCEQYGGFLGAIAYWGHTLTEEACDLFEFEDMNNRVKYSHMRHCPSRGMLNALSHVEPYYDYCSHCNVIYARVLDKYGVVYERDNSEIANAECRGCFYEKDHAPDFDFRTVKDADLAQRSSEEGINIIDMKSEDNKYLHQDFHTLADNALKYCAEKYGYDSMLAFLRDYAEFFYAPIIDKIKAEGLAAVEKWIKDTYKAEDASELIHTALTDTTLEITVDKCPAIRYMHTLGQEPSKYFIEETRTVYSTVAAKCGLRFNLNYYNEDGGTKFVFEKP